MKNIILYITFGFLLMLLISSCGGGRMLLTTDRLDYPVSTSPGIYDENYNILNEGDYTVVTSNPSSAKAVTSEESLEEDYYTTDNTSDMIDIEGDHFKFSVSRWSIFWTIIPISDNPDISEQLNRIIEEKQGDGIVELTVYTSTANPINWLGSIVPIIPTSVSAVIKGKVIKLRK